MTKKMPKSLRDAIKEDPDRFIEYLDINKIISSSNPYMKFLRQFEKRFGSRQGLNLWQYLIERYNYLNLLYKAENLQSKLSKDFKGSLNRQTTMDFFIKRSEKIKKKQDEILEEAKKERKLKRYLRKEERYILIRKDLSLRELTNQFNRFFKGKRTIFAIRDKRLRLLGKK